MEIRPNKNFVKWKFIFKKKFSAMKIQSNKNFIKLKSPFK